MGIFDRWKNKTKNATDKDLVDLYESTASKLQANTDEQLQFLEYASQLYKYHLDSLLAAYAQAPNAKYLADFDTWKKVGRHVSKGQKAIKILHQNGNGYFYHENLFDVSQTTGKDVNFPKWEMNKSEFSDTMNELLQTNHEELTFSSDKPEAVLYTVIESNVSKLSDGQLSELEIENVLSCVHYMTLYKLGQSPVQTPDVQKAARLLFTNSDDFTRIFPKVLEITKQSLLDVAAVKTNLTKERENEYTRRSIEIRKEDERSQSAENLQNRTNRQTGIRGRRGRATVSEIGTTQKQSRTKFNGTMDSELSNGTTVEPISRTSTEQRTDDLPTDEREGIQGSDVRYLSGIRSTTTSRTDTVDTSTTTEPVEATGRGTSQSGALSRELEQPAPITEKEILETLKVHWTGIQEGKFRIVDFFTHEKNTLKQRSFVKKEFGTGGAFGRFTDRLSIDYSPRDVTFSDGVVNNYPRRVTKNWSEVTSSIRYLIDTDQYLSEDEKSAYTDYLSKQATETAQTTKVPPTEYFRELVRSNLLRNLKLDIHDYFQNHPSSEEQLLYVKEQFGVGGLSSPDNPYNYHWTEKGFLLHDRVTEENHAYSWSEVTDTIREFIRTQQYMNEADYQREVTEVPIGTSNENHFSESSDSSLAESSDWSVLPEGYRYQELNNKCYLINEQNEFEKDAYEIEIEHGITYYRPYVVAQQPTTSPVEENNQSIDLFSFSYDDQPELEKNEFSFTVNADNDFYEKTPKAKLQANLAAIRLLKKLEKETRNATQEEQVILAKYVGWGGLSDVFDESKESYRDEKKELRSLLSPEEYSSARDSVLTSYYTDPQIVQEMYRTLNKFGFKSGRILDPSMGTGNFFAAMPDDMHHQSELYGVELDSLSARLAKQLHQQTTIQAKGYEDVPFSEDSFDVVISNVPFADIQIQDNKTLDRHYVHDYFITHSLDLVREGGIVAVITSAGTLDKKDPRFREELNKKAALLGAVRLPDTAFKQIAGTEVVSDILFFQKKPKLKENEQELVHTKSNWVETIELASGVQLEDGTPQPPMTINEYFRTNNFKDVLGKFKFKNFRGGMYTVTPKEDTSLQELLSERLSLIDGFYYPTDRLNDPLPKELNEPSVSSDIPPFSFYEQSDGIYYYTGQHLEKQELKPAAKKRMQSMIKLREQVLELIKYQQSPDFTESGYNSLSNKLTSTYDRFVSHYGFLNSPTNSRLFYPDDHSALLASIELPQQDGSYKKAEIFQRPTIRPIVPVTKVDTAIEALHHSLAKKGHIDMDYMQSLYDVSEETLIQELEGHIYPDCKRYVNGHLKM